MKCSCDIDVDIDSADIPDFINRQDVIAIIDHKCDECGRIIKQDEAYELVYGRWEWGAETQHTCSDCLNLRNIFFPYGHFFSLLWEYFENSLHEWNYQIPENCMVKLTKRNLYKICEMIEERWEYLEDMEEYRNGTIS